MQMNVKIVVLFAVFLSIGLAVGYGVGFVIHQQRISQLESEISALYVGTIPLKTTGASMYPTIKSGDIVLVKPVANISEIRAEYGTGDIVVFLKPGDPSRLIAHRAVEITEDNGLKTKGDNSAVDGWIVHYDDLIGKVVDIIPRPS